MSNHVAWLLLSFAIMVVAMLATLYEKVESLQKRLERLEMRDGAAGDGVAGVDPEQLTFTERVRGHRDHRG
jgi:hypothetical protein